MAAFFSAAVFSLVIGLDRNAIAEAAMVPFLPNRPKTLSLGPLETEIVEILWALGPTSATAIHQHILQDIDRELTYSSVSTVLKRLIKKGWVSCDRSQRVHVWRSLISQKQAKILQAHEQLYRFLAVGSPEVVAAFADTLDDESMAQIDAIAQKVQAARQAREAQGQTCQLETPQTSASQIAASQTSEGPIQDGLEDSSLGGQQL